MVSITLTWKVSKGGRIAQLLILPYVGIGHSNKKRGSRGFGSTGQAVIFLTEKILESKPTCQVNISDKNFQGLIDTGANVSIICSQHWPKAWPTRPAPISIVGLGQAQGLKVQWYCLIQGLINNQLLSNLILLIYLSIYGVVISWNNGMLRYIFLHINIARSVAKLCSVKVIYQDWDWAKINKEEFILWLLKILSCPLFSSGHCSY